MKLPISILLLSLLIIGCTSDYNSIQQTDFTKYVDPIIGTAASTTVSGLKHGHGSEQNSQVQPSVTAPFGMTNWTPQTQNWEKKCFSSYYYKDSVITGFRGSHWLSGSCTQEYGSFAIMPISGNLVVNPWKRGSKFSHDDEVSLPNYYKTYLEDYNIKAEMTASTRSAIFKFKFNDEGNAHIVINPNSDEGEGYIEVIPEKNEIVGYNPVHRIYQGWGKSAGFAGYFVLKVEKEIKSYGVFVRDNIYPNETIKVNKNDLGGYFTFNVEEGEVIKVKVGSSFVSIDQARKNLNSEIPNWDFGVVRNNLKDTWNDLLSKIQVEGNSEEEKVKFYTAMYHSFQQPRIYNDIDGSYPQFNGNTKVDTIAKGNYYCDFSVWDTYRALHSLYNIIIPDVQADMVRSLLIKSKVSGWMPIFPNWNSYTSAMIGDHVTSIIAESYIKGVVDLTEEDYQIIKKNADKVPEIHEDYVDGKGRRALKSYLKYGYIPLEDKVEDAFHHNEQVSRTLEYSYDDFALAQIAKKMGKQDDYQYYLNRSKNYKNVFDASVNNMNGRYKNGSFLDDFNRTERTFYITEGSPWQYNWYVPHDVTGLIDLMGGKDAFNADLDEFFETDQYWHGNEPGHQIPFLYTYSGQPWKTQKIVSKIMQNEYGIGPGGLSGNDDAGQMSAWYIFGAIGFYPVCPVLPEYRLSGPKFERILLKLGNGNQIEIRAADYSSKKIFIENMIFNDKVDSKPYIQHNKLMGGGLWQFTLSDTPTSYLSHKRYD